MKIDHHHGKSTARIGLRVPPVAPSVTEAALWATVDDEDDRVLTAFYITGLSYHVAIDLFVVPPRETELFVDAELRVPKARVHRGELKGIILHLALRLSCTFAGRAIHITGQI